MKQYYSAGIAFVFEGETEKVFYHEMLKYFNRRHPEYLLEEKQDMNTGERYFVLSSDQNKVLIKLNNVGTVSQVSNSADWFHNRCYSENKRIGWTIFLCYDTDSYSNDIGKFQEGDWKALRTSIGKHRGCKVIDLAAKADIEDTLLLDVAGVFAFLGMPVVPVPTGNKGKSKMKKIFRLKGRGSAYHEGERARTLIESLDMEKIISKSSIPFLEIEKHCFL